MTYHSLPEVAAQMRLDEHMKHPERWLAEQIAKGRFTGRKVGRRLLMSDEDIAEANEVMRVGGRHVVRSDSRGLSAASMRRRMAVAS